MEPWSADASEAAVDTYLSGATLQQIATLVGRSQNAVAWKLWTIAGVREDLKTQLLARGDAAPRTYADLRIRKSAFRWVLVHLRSATALWLTSGQPITLQALSKHAENALLLWDGRPSHAAEIEQTVAHWLFSYPALWAAESTSAPPTNEPVELAPDDAA